VQRRAESISRRSPELDLERVAEVACGVELPGRRVEDREEEQPG
jgi:hypothetical protein